MPIGVSIKPQKKSWIIYANIEGGGPVDLYGANIALAVIAEDANEAISKASKNLDVNYGKDWLITHTKEVCVALPRDWRS